MASRKNLSLRNLIIYRVIVNVFVALVGDGFGETKYKSRFEWLKKSKVQTDDETQSLKKETRDEKREYDSAGGRAISVTSNYSMSISRLMAKKE